MREERLNKIDKLVDHTVLSTPDGEVRYRYTKIDTEDYEWLIEQAKRVQELEEDNENLQILSDINRKEHMRIHEQNQRYRKTLEEIARGRFPGASYKARKALEGDSDE